MLERWGRITVSHRWWIIAVTIGFVVFASLWGTRVFGALITNGGFDDPGSESSQAIVRAEETLGRSGNDIVVLYSSPDLTAQEPPFQEAVESTLNALPDDVVTRTLTFWDTSSPALVSQDRHATYAVLTLAGADDGERVESLEKIEDQLDAPGLQTQVGGIIAVGRDISERVGADIARAETISVPVLLLLLVLVFGSVAAAGLPLAIGAVSILGPSPRCAG